MDASLVTAWCMGIAGIIAAIAGVVKIVITRPRIPVAEDVLERMATLEDWCLEWGTWAHRVLMMAAQKGWGPLPPPPMDPAERRTPHRLTPHLTDRGPDTNPMGRVRSDV